MGKLYDTYFGKAGREGFTGLGGDPPVSRAEFEALRAKVTELEKRYRPRNAMTPAEKQRAYRERKRNA